MWTLLIFYSIFAIISSREKFKTEKYNYSVKDLVLAPIMFLFYVGKGLVERDYTYTTENTSDLVLKEKPIEESVENEVKQQLLSLDIFWEEYQKVKDAFKKANTWEEYSLAEESFYRFQEYWNQSKEVSYTSHKFATDSIIWTRKNAKVRCLS